MKKKRTLSLMLAALIMFAALITPNVRAYADNLILALSDRTVNIGDKVTVTIRMPAGITGTVNLSYSQDVFTYSSASSEATSNAGTVSITLGDYSGDNARASGTVTFEAKAAGTGNFSASAPNANNQDGDKVSVEGAGTSVTVLNSTGTTASDSAKSSDNSLSSLTLSSGTLSPSFSKDVKSYTAEVDNDVTELTVSAATGSSSAIVESVTGADELAVGENTVTVTVRAENGVTDAYTIVVTRKAADGVGEAETVDMVDTEETTGSAVDQALVAQIADLQSQNRMLLCGFVLVVLFLLIVIVVLVVRGRKKEAYYNGFIEEPEDSEEEVGEPEIADTPIESYAEVLEPDEAAIEETASEEIEPVDMFAEAILAQAKAATGKLDIDEIAAEVAKDEAEAAEKAAEEAAAEEVVAEEVAAEEETKEIAEESEPEEEPVSEEPQAPTEVSSDDDDDLIFLDI